MTIPNSDTGLRRPAALGADAGPSPSGIGASPKRTLLSQPHPHLRLVEPTKEQQDD
jgi:hypothetical protein